MSVCRQGYEAPGLNGDLSSREEARGAGRPAKVDRQEMVGTWAAIRRWTKTVDHEDRKARIKEECLKMVAPFEGIPGVVAKISDSEYGHQPYGIMVHIDEAVTGVVS
jgi:seryl-tRNA(Sec) selenium transferase